MKDWSYWINVRNGAGHVECVTQPWWLAFLDWFAFWIAWDWLDRIPLPDWPAMQWAGEEDSDDKYTPREYWGDVGGLVHGFITNPLIQWVHKHQRRKEVVVEIGYDRIKKLFYTDAPEWFDECEARADDDEQPPTTTTPAEATA